MFASPQCEACGDLVDDLVRWQADEDGPRVIVLSPGSRDAIAAKFGDVHVFAHDGSAADAYGMEYTPGAVVVSGDHYVTTPPMYGADEVRRLYFALSGHGAEADLTIGPAPVREGDPLPDVAVEYEGTSMPIAQAAARVGDDVVLLFWDTTCSFCAQIADDVARRVNLVPMLIVLRDDDVAALEASGIMAPLALDPAFAVGDALQAPGTPCAVRVRDGVLASTVAVGGPEVLGLLAAVRVGS